MKGWTRNNGVFRTLGLLAPLFCLLALASPVRPAADPIELQYPATWPKPRYDLSKNPLTRAGIELGRRIFYDPVLSRDSSISCASCHLSYTAFTHVDHALSHGIDNRIGIRNSPALMNLAWANTLMWDGAVSHLDFQALAPISNPVEMDHSLEKVLQKMQQNPAYRARFQAAFGDSILTGEHFLQALAQFELTLISANSKYDQVMQGNEKFSEQEQNGYRLFQQNCASCHSEPFFTHFGFEKNGLPVDTSLNDFGRMRITKDPSDSLLFKVPTLRNIEFSSPYMHDGRFKKLKEVLNHYTQTEALKRKIELTPNEKVDLTAFLLCLSDRSFLFNPDFGFPR